jgi:hypothetical protein
MKTELSVFVFGDPKGQPRPRAFSRNGKAAVYDPGTAEGWKGLIADAVKSQLPDSPIEGPLAVELYFYIRRPKSHFKKDKLKQDAPIWCEKKPDADNFAKAVMDCLTQIGFWKDDSQVVNLYISKVFADNRVGCLIEVDSF